MIALLTDLSVKATLLCLAAVVVTAMMRRASAASRHLVWTGMFLAVLALPIARVLMPGLPVFVLAPRVLQALPTPPPVTTPAVEAVPATVAPASSAAPTLVWLNPEPAPAIVAEPVRPNPLTVSDVVVPVWLCGVFLLFVRAAVGRVRVRLLNRSASALTDTLVLGRVHELRRVFGVRRPIVVRTASEGMPMTWGIRRPVILMPSTALDTDANGRRVLEPLLVHEVAHIARLDAVSVAITRLAVTLGWFNPLLWLAARQARLERERACDDAVLTRGVGLKASDYANQLLLLAQFGRPSMADGSHTLAMARRSQLESRVRSILDAGTNRRATSRVSRLVAAALVIVAVPGAAVRLAARTVTLSPPAETIAMPTPVALPVDPAVVTETVRRREPVTVPPATQTVAPISPAVPEAPAPQDAARPAPPNYVIGVNDLLTIIVWRSPELSGDVRVGSDGRIALARGNPISAAGWTVAGLRDAVTEELKRCCLASPDVIIQVKMIVSRMASGHSAFFFFNQDVAADAAARRLDLATSFAQQPDWNTLWRTLSAREFEAEKNLAIRVHVGQSTPLDQSEMKRARQALDSLAPWSRRPSDAELFALRSRFGDAVRNLDVVEVRFDNGLVSVKALADAYVAAAEALKRPSDVQFVSANTPQVEARLVSSSPLSDAELTTALKNAATIGPDAARADALLALAQQYAFTPDMVALYVAAARGIASDADRARVFAQPIRVK